jgi:8-oxo-dGTP pyrophosphatase MutT (NUDIX family)
MTPNLAWPTAALPSLPDLAAAACVLIPNQYVTHFLAVSRKENRQTWGLPGGKVEMNECASTAAIRETYEETGLIINPNQLSLLTAGQVLGTDGKDYWVTTFLCLNTPANINSMRPEKGTELAWQEADFLTSKAHSPFASYHEAVLGAFERQIADCRFSRQRAY